MSWDLTAIRQELADVGAALGYTPWPFVPNDIQQMPAIVVGVPTEIVYGRTFQGGSATITLPVTIVVDWGSAEDAEQRLNAAVSSGTPGSLFDAYQARVGVNFKNVNPGTARDWRKATAGESTALAVDLILTVIA